MKIKICGLKREEDIHFVNQEKPDFIGFVFAGKKRKIDFATAKSLKETLDSEIPSVGVFVNEDISYIVRLVKEGILDVVQLHGDEDASYVANLRKELDKVLENGGSGISIIKAVRVKSMEQVLAAEKLDVDYLLLDAFVENEYGGSGKIFDHHLIPELSKPYFLAGGITVNNVAGILDMLKGNMPYCIDVSSSVETDGVKDGDKIKEIVSLVKSL